jgi:hypothetical protein
LKRGRDDCENCGREIKLIFVNTIKNIGRNGCEYCCREIKWIIVNTTVLRIEQEMIVNIV